MNKQQKEIKKLIQKFCLVELDKEQNRFAIDLLKLIISDPVLDIDRGKVNIWAASIVYVIARLNFSFDKESDTYISIDQLCDFFGTVKSTTGNKATQIEQAYEITPGDEDFTKPEIAEIFKVHVTEDGWIFPASMINGKHITFGILSPEEEVEFKKLEQEKRQKHQDEIEARAKIRQEEARLKKLNPNQMDLF